MAAIYYGTHVFNKTLGNLGETVKCSYCQKTYKRIYIKHNRWFHIEFIPLIPLPARYSCCCPICGDADTLKGKEAKALIAAHKNDTSAPELTPHIRYYKDSKCYSFSYTDNATGEEIPVSSDMKKGDLKPLLKTRGLKFNKKDVETI